MDISPEFLLTFIQDKIAAHQSKRNEQELYMDYYEGEHAILHKTQEDPYKPNNILKFNFPELIIETNHSYLFSNPLSYNEDIDDPLVASFMEELENIFFDNDEEFKTSSIGKSSAIYGEAVEVLYRDKDGKIRFEESSPTEWIFFQFKGEEYALRYYKVEDYIIKNGKYEKTEIEKYEIYSSVDIKKYKLIDGKLELEEGYPKLHRSGEVPVILYENKATHGIAGQSDLKNIITLVDAYNKAMSAIADTIEYNADPYLLLINLAVTVGMSEEEARAAIAEMRKSRTLEFQSDPSVTSEAKFLQWDHNIEAYEKFLDRLVRKIFILSFTPDLFSKEGLAAGDSGIALKMKYTGTEMKSQAKIKSFIRAIRKRIRLIAKLLEFTTSQKYYSSGAYRHINIDFNKSMPVNRKEEIETAVQALGVLSKKTVIEKYISTVENADAELERIEEEQGMPLESFLGDDAGAEDE